MKIKATVKRIFEFDTDKNKYSDIVNEAEILWDERLNLCKEDECYQEDVVDISYHTWEDINE